MSLTPDLCKNLYKLPLQIKQILQLSNLFYRLSWNIPNKFTKYLMLTFSTLIRRMKMVKEYLDRYSVTMDRFGGLVTAPINSTMLGCRKDFMIATYHAKIRKNKTRVNKIIHASRTHIIDISTTEYLSQKLINTFRMEVLFCKDLHSNFLTCPW